MKIHPHKGNGPLGLIQQIGVDSFDDIPSEKIKEFVEYRKKKAVEWTAAQGNYVTTANPYDSWFTPSQVRSFFNRDPEDW